MVNSKNVLKVDKVFSCFKELGSTQSVFAQSIPSNLKWLLQLRFHFDSTRQRKWASWQYVNEGMNSYNHTRQHFPSEVCERAIPTLTIEGCYPMLIRHRECHSYYRAVV